MARLNLTVQTIEIPDDILAFLSEHTVGHLASYTFRCVCGATFTHAQTDLLAGAGWIEACRKEMADGDET